MINSLRAALLFTAAISGCDMSGMTEPSVPTTCSRIAEKCQLPDGPLGVCIETRCEADEKPPCFACTPQH